MCKCREKNKAKGSLGAFSLLMEMSMAEPIVFVSLGLNATAPLGGKVFIPARIDKLLRGVDVPQLRLRMLTIASREQSVPSVIREWMMQDYRFKAWFAAVPAPVESLETLLEEDDEATVGGVSLLAESLEPSLDIDENIAESEESLFDLWERADIEDANLTGEDGLLAYAAYKGIDLEDASRKPDVLEVILDWYDDQLD